MRRAAPPTHLTLRSLLRVQADVAVTEIVIMELLAGNRSDEHASRLIAVSTISAGATLLHRNADFDTLAAHTPLQLQPLVDDLHHH